MLGVFTNVCSVLLHDPGSSFPSLLTQKSHLQGNQSHLEVTQDKTKEHTGLEQRYYLFRLPWVAFQGSSAPHSCPLKTLLYSLSQSPLRTKLVNDSNIQILVLGILFPRYLQFNEADGSLQNKPEKNQKTLLKEQRKGALYRELGAPPLLRKLMKGLLLQNKF